MGKAARILGILLLALAVLLGVYAGVGYLGWQSGQQMRSEQAAREQIGEVARQVQFARSDIDLGNYALALRRLEWVDEQDPENVTAQELRLIAEAALSGPDEANPLPLPAPTEGVGPTPAATPDTEPSRRLRQLEQLANDQEWAEAVAGLVAFQQTYPNVARRETDVLLFDVYTSYGVALLYTDQAELGLYYLRQAEELGDLPLEVSDQRQWARLYLSAISFFDVNWDVSIFYLRDLCLAAPFFHDACALLQEALVTYADQYATQLEWCPAETLYAEAYRINNGQEIARKLGAARTGCASATPPITGTIPITGALPISGTLPAPPDVIEGP